MQRPRVLRCDVRPCMVHACVLPRGPDWLTLLATAQVAEALTREQQLVQKLRAEFKEASESSSRLVRVHSECMGGQCGLVLFTGGAGRAGGGERGGHPSAEIH